MLVALASYAAYVAVLSVAGRVELAAVISQTANFFRGTAGDVIAEARVLNRGRRLVATETRLLAADAEDKLLAQVTAIYSLPAPKS
jgi:acyl-coenzyme A thioesterase PaaI-like protein